MPINRGLWQHSLAETYAPLWPCPSCAGGTLRLKRDTLHYQETAASRRSHHDEDSHITDVTLVFVTMLECNRCNEKIACCGEGGYEPEYYQDEDGGHSSDELIFFPKYFSQPMRIFLPPNRCPNAVKAQLRKSFAVFFCDLGAAANHVRQCVEEILTHASIGPRNARGKFVTMEKRIQSFAQIDHENAERADALRWIGNFGSHPEALTKRDLFDAYDILEVFLEDLYVGHHRSVREMVQQINAARGPRT